ncbi:DUF1007 family protein [Prosthecodimorpha staleyi]|uniref:DUF1007 family protein n=1 Tax=Prosthecodimorpha staleyi TaxID=2840188 RepID=A0A947GGY0_9HYPH|nr:DUF1007 family protein [Prosthecodimorpha staleyi]MBT9293015.1 DUF1007 family protein [Prosthecodimorpha staleyi]
MVNLSRASIASLAILGALFGAALPAAAHPHVFVDARAELVFDAKGQISAIRQVWRFDDAFSAFATQGLDTDGDGKFSKEELQPLAKINVESLKEYDYFTFLKLAGKRKGFKLPSEYWLQMRDGFLTLFYTLPLIEPIAAKGVQVDLEVYDPGYFVDFTLVDQEPALLVGSPPGCSVNVHKKGEPEGATAAILSQIPATERDLPSDLQAITRELANRITVKCP